MTVSQKLKRTFGAYIQNVQHCWALEVDQQLKQANHKQQFCLSNASVNIAKSFNDTAELIVPLYTISLHFSTLSASGPNVSH